MKGVIFNIVEDVITEHLGDAAWDQLLLDAGIEHGYTALGNYSDAQMMALVDAAAAATHKTPHEVMCWLGERAVVYFFERYPHYFERHDSARDFLPSLDRIIHPEVRKLYQDAEPPSFDCTSDDEGDMTVVYSSHRPMCALAHGLMRGVADYYREAIRIEQPECVHAGGAQCRFQLYFA